MLRYHQTHSKVFVKAIFFNCRSNKRVFAGPALHPEAELDGILHRLGEGEQYVLILATHDTQGLFAATGIPSQNGGMSCRGRQSTLFSPLSGHSTGRRILKTFSGQSYAAAQHRYQCAENMLAFYHFLKYISRKSRTSYKL